MTQENNILRIVDANLNRLREALRVLEEITRFILEEKGLTEDLKCLRHEAFIAVSQCKNIKYSSLIKSRDPINDVGKKTISNELKREGSSDVLNANLQRAKESVRVLEEFTKVLDSNLALTFKSIRFKIYDIEKALIEKFSAASNTG